MDLIGKRVMQGMMAIDAREELRSFEKWARKSGIDLRRLLKRVEEEEAEKHHINEMAKAKLHVDYEGLRHDEDVVKYGVWTCRLPLNLVQTLIQGVCFAYPNSLPERLPAIAMFLLWIYCFDDFFDDCHIVGEDPDIETTLAFVQNSLRSLLLEDRNNRSIIPAMDNKPSSSHDLRSSGISLQDVMRGAAPWCDRVRHLGMPTSQRRRFVETFGTYAAAVFEQNQYRSSGSYPADVPAYLALRTSDSGTYCCLDLVEFSLGIDVLLSVQLPPALRAALDSLCFSSAVQVGLYNDLRSIQKDVDGNDVFNMIMYVYVQMMKMMKKKTMKKKIEDEDPESPIKLVEAAMKEVVKMVADYSVESKKLEVEIHKELFLFLTSSKNESNELEQRTLVAADIRSFVGGLADVISGLGRWQQLSLRYNS